MDLDNGLKSVRTRVSATRASLHTALGATYAFRMEADNDPDYVDFVKGEYEKNKWGKVTAATLANKFTTAVRMAFNAENEDKELDVQPINKYATALFHLYYNGIGITVGNSKVIVKKDGAKIAADYLKNNGGISGCAAKGRRDMVPPANDDDDVETPEAKTIRIAQERLEKAVVELQGQHVADLDMDDEDSEKFVVGSEGVTKDGYVVLLAKIDKFGVSIVDKFPWEEADINSQITKAFMPKDETAPVKGDKNPFAILADRMKFGKGVSKAMAVYMNDEAGECRVTLGNTGASNLIASMSGSGLSFLGSGTYGIDKVSEFKSIVSKMKGWKWRKTVDGNKHYVTVTNKKITVAAWIKDENAKRTKDFNSGKTKKNTPYALPSAWKSVPKDAHSIRMHLETSDKDLAGFDVPRVQNFGCSAVIPANQATNLAAKWSDNKTLDGTQAYLSIVDGELFLDELGRANKGQRKSSWQLASADHDFGVFVKKMDFSDALETFDALEIESVRLDISDHILKFSASTDENEYEVWLPAQTAGPSGRSPLALTSWTDENSAL